MQPLTPQSFLNHLAGGLAACQFLNPLERSMLQYRIDACAKARDFWGVAPVVRDYAFYLARDFVRRIPEPVTARLLGPNGADEPIREILSGGATLSDGIFPHEEFVIEVRCRTGAFLAAGDQLPHPGNWEIALREMEEGFDWYGHMVVFGGSGGGGRWVPKEDRSMAFRMPSPGLVLSKLRARKPGSAFDPVYVGGLVTFQVYEDLIGRKVWPLGMPVDRRPVDDEGDQHPLYFLYHDLGHGTIRSRRPKALKALAHRLLQAGLSVFPEIDGVSPQNRQGGILSRFFSRLIELKFIYLADQVAEEWKKTEAAFLDSRPDEADLRRLERFKAELQRAFGSSTVAAP